MSSISRGVSLAVAAALAFGATTPIVAWAGAWVGPLSTAALLYLGAALASLIVRAARPNDAGLRRRDAARIVLVAIAGGAIAPALLAWGLHHTGAMIGALLLNLEAVFTVVLARLVFREPIGARVAAAVAAIAGGGTVLVLGASGTEWTALGVLAIAGATAAWALDNTWTRPLAERDPLAVVAAKGTLGAALTTTVAVLAGETLPPLRPALILAACGATGYGVSLWLYLLAQRRIGAGRTGSVFALAPFVGAALAIAFGERAFDATAAFAAALFGIGVYLHVTEDHDHAHVHHADTHDHAHRHDDDHHLHAHDPPFSGEHSHVHHHDELAHDHDHGLDLHHDHGHG